MKHFIALSLGAGLVLGALGPAVRGSEPPGQPTLSSSRSSQRLIGKVAVLENDRTLTGDIEKIGDQYRIKRLIGETWLPASKVHHLCASMEEAYAFLRARANLADPDERVRLVEWCRQHDLDSQAILEAKEALKLNPSDLRIRRLLNHLEDVHNRKAKPTAVARTPQPAGPHVEVSAESLGLFASKVHPILMNACARCHTGGRGGSFNLIKIQGSAMSSRRSMDQNLAEVLSQLNSREPQYSKLLTKAISIHGPGMTLAPLKGRQAVAYRTLEQWVIRTIETNPHLRQEETASKSTTQPPADSRVEINWGADREPPQKAGFPTSPPPKEMKPTVTPSPSPASMTPLRPAPVTGQTVVPTKPKEKEPVKKSNDPVDPDDFNREFHPMKNG